MKDQAAKIRANASRRLAAAERALAAANTSVQAQAHLVEQLRLRGEDAGTAETLLGNFRQVAAERKRKVGEETAAFERLRQTPDWKLNETPDGEAPDRASEK
jgi:hypothetical protein